MVHSQTYRVKDHAADNVRVHVGRRPAVFEVALLLRLCCPRDTDGRSPVGHTVGERVHVGGLVLPSQSALIALAYQVRVSRVQVNRFRSRKQSGKCLIT